jgi:hypothetical protein
LGWNEERERKKERKEMENDKIERKKRATLPGGRCYHPARIESSSRDQIEGTAAG